MAANKGTFTTSNVNALGEQPKDVYFNRNGAWLRPVLATALLLSFYGMAPSLDLSISLPPLSLWR